MTTKSVNNAILVNSRKLAYVSGTDAKGPYEFIASLVDVGGKLHDVTFEKTLWETISQAATPLTKVVLSGDLIVEDDGYVVYANDETKRYVRGKLRNVNLVDLIDTAGSAVAFKRGSRLPSWEQLKAEAQTTQADDDFTNE